MSSSNQESSHHAIETAVPLIRPGNQKDHGLEEQCPERSSKSTHSIRIHPDLKLFLTGGLLGVFLFSLSLAAHEWMYLRYGNDKVFPTNDILEQIRYGALFCVSYSWLTFYPLTCVFFVDIISRPTRFHQVSKLVTGQENTSVDDFFKMTALLDCGFCFGSSWTGLGLELLFGLSPCWVAILSTILLNLATCSLVGLCYYLSTWVGEEENEEYEYDERQDQAATSVPYVAIV